MAAAPLLEFIGTRKSRLNLQAYRKNLGFSANSLAIEHGRRGCPVVESSSAPLRECDDQAAESAWNRRDKAKPRTGGHS